jgi:hypothetical protein
VNEPGGGRWWGWSLWWGINDGNVAVMAIVVVVFIVSIFNVRALGYERLGVVALIVVIVLLLLLLGSIESALVFLCFADTALRAAAVSNGVYDSPSERERGRGRDIQCEHGIRSLGSVPCNQGR